MHLDLLSSFAWCPCMAINVIVQYNGGSLPDILLLTQAPIVWFDGTTIVYYYTLLIMFYIVSCFVWCPCMAIDASKCKV